MRTSIALGAVLALGACGGQTANLGGTGPDGGQETGATTDAADAKTDARRGTSDSSSVTPRVDVCKGAGAKREAGAGGDGGPPQSCIDSTACSPPEECIVLPGTGSEGHCGPPCESDCDCPAWLSCQSGVCSACSSCPTGQTCYPVGKPTPPSCASNTDCELGLYCEGSCQAYLFCTDCFNNCPTCTVNSQCLMGQVCAGGTCGTCSSDSQCGPSAKCTVTHQGAQCTCTTAADCEAGETCSDGLCNDDVVGCAFSGCPEGQACVSNTCGACVTFTDCNQVPFQSGTIGTSGLACIDGACKACTANSQCGGGQACVDGTCGTCSANDQCGPKEDCFFGFCICTSDAQCAPGQRCGAGVCVEM